MLRTGMQAGSRPAQVTNRVMTRSGSSLSEALKQYKDAVRSAASDPEPVPSLRSKVIDTRLHEQLWTASSQALAAAPSHTPSDLEARSAAEAYATCHALSSVLNQFEAYDLRTVVRKPVPRAGDPAEPTSDDLFRQQIRPQRKAFLLSEFEKTWAANDEIRQAAILSVLSPDVANELGLAMSSAHGDLISQWDPAAVSQRLCESEFLALIDYVNSSTGTFNAVNGAAIAHAYYGDKCLTELMRVFTTALNNAVNKLCAHPYFGKSDIMAYKGINLNNPSGRFRLGMLEAAKGTGKIIAFPGLLSATSSLHRSYAVTKHMDGYRIECHIRMRRAFDADPFHDVYTMGEMEVVAPAGERFVVLAEGDTEREYFDGEHSCLIQCFHLAPAPASKTG